MPRIVVAEDAPKRGGGFIVPPATPESLAPLLVAVGIALAVAGWLDVLLFYWPPQFGDKGWEFGTVAQTMDSMPLPALGLALLALGLRGSAARRFLTRPFALALIFVALACAGLLALFCLDIDTAFRAMGRAARAAVAQGSAPNPYLSSDLKRGVAKTVVLGVTYILLYASLGWQMWRGPSYSSSG
jgi:ABC-type multidrug transport system permease subunit